MGPFLRAKFHDPAPHTAAVAVQWGLLLLLSWLAWGGERWGRWALSASIGGAAVIGVVGFAVHLLIARPHGAEAMVWVSRRSVASALLPLALFALSAIATVARSWLLLLVVAGVAGFFVAHLPRSAAEPTAAEGGAAQ